MPDTIEQPVSGSETREIEGDVKASGGNISHDGNLHVTGTIRDGVTVEVEGDLAVDGSIEASQVRASGQIAVGESIMGRGAGKCSAQGSIKFNVANAATIESGEDITGGAEVASCRVVCVGVFACEAGRIVGGHITSLGGMKCQMLGNSAGVETIVEIGIDERLRTLSKARLPEISRNQKKIELVRTKIAPLMTQPKLLTPDQKETATALLYDASQLEETTQGIIKQLRKFVEDLGQPENPELVVTQTIHPGVTIRFNGVEAKIEETIQGPVKLWVKTVGFTVKLMATDLRTDATHFMKSTAYTDPVATALRQAIAEPTK